MDFSEALEEVTRWADYNYISSNEADSVVVRELLRRVTDAEHGFGLIKGELNIYEAGAIVAAYNRLTIGETFTFEGVTVSGTDFTAIKNLMQGGNKIQAIKALRATNSGAGMGLKAAKDWVEAISLDASTSRLDEYIARLKRDDVLTPGEGGLFIEALLASDTFRKEMYKDTKASEVVAMFLQGGNQLWHPHYIKLLNCYERAMLTPQQKRRKEIEAQITQLQEELREL